MVLIERVVAEMGKILSRIHLAEGYQISLHLILSPMTQKIRHRGKVADVFAELERDRLTFAWCEVSHFFRCGDDLIGKIVLVNVDV